MVNDATSCGYLLWGVSPSLRSEYYAFSSSRILGVKGKNSSENELILIL